MMDRRFQKRDTGFPYNLYHHFDNYLKFNTRKALTRYEISSLLLLVSQLTDNPGLLAELLVRYPFNFNAGAKALCRKAIEFSLREDESAMRAQALELNDEEERLFYLMLMVIAYLKGFSSYGLLRSILVRKSSDFKATEAVYLATLTESLSYFCPIDHEREKVA